MANDGLAADSVRSSFQMDGQQTGSCGFCTDAGNCVCNPSQSVEPGAAGNCE